MSMWNQTQPEYNSSHGKSTNIYKNRQNITNNWVKVKGQSSF
jgi:hypothetical protein